MDDARLALRGLKESNLSAAAIRNKHLDPLNLDKPGPLAFDNDNYPLRT